MARTPSTSIENYGNVFIVWDRLFGTFEPEVARVRYGLLTNINTYNPLRIAFAEWVRLCKDSLQGAVIRAVGAVVVASAPQSTGARRA
jgi:hypothetical protein